MASVLRPPTSDITLMRLDSPVGTLHVLAPRCAGRFETRLTRRARAVGKLLDRSDPDSELNRLNRDSDRWVSVSADLSNVLDVAFELYDDTCGRFDPTHRAWTQTGAAPGLSGVERRRDRLHLHRTRLEFDAIAGGVLVDAISDELAMIGLDRFSVSLTVGATKVERSHRLIGSVLERLAVAVTEGLRIEASTAARALGLSTCSLPKDPSELRMMFAECGAVGSTQLG